MPKDSPALRSAFAIVLLAAFLGLLWAGERPSLAGWGIAASVLAGAWLGWWVRQAWIYPALLARAEALWAGGGPASEVAEHLSRANLATGELGYRIHLLRATAHLSLGYRDRAWLDGLQAQLCRLPLWKRVLAGTAFRKVPGRPTARRLAWVSRLVRLAPRLARLHHLQGILRLREEGSESLAQAWAAFEAALPLAADDPLLLEDLLLAGLQHGRAGMAESALDLLRNRHQDPRIPWDRGAAGLHLLRQGRYGEALALVAALPAARRTHPLHWLCETVALRQLGDREGAWNRIEEAVRWLPEAFRLWMERYQIALERREEAQALASLERAWAVLPAGEEGDELRLEWRLRRAEFALWWEDDPDHARRLLAQVPEAKQGDHHPPLGLQIQVALGAYEAALEALEPLLAASPGDPELLMLQADCLAGVDAWEALLPFLDSLPEPCRNRPLFWHLRGLALAHLGDHLRARPDLERAARMDPEHPRFLLDAGHACAELGEWDRAESHWRQALQVDPRDEEALIQLADARRELQDPEGARRYLRECLLHHPESLDAQSRLAELEAH